MEDTVTITEFETFPAAFLAVYDGHGGTQASSLLQQFLHRYVLDEACASLDPPASPAHREDSSACSTPPYDADEPGLAPDVDVPAALRAAYAKMDAMLKKRRCVCVGATAVTCVLRRSAAGVVLTTANCGDARAVLCRSGRPLRLSEDHRPGGKMEGERVVECGGFVTNGRVNGVLNVSRAFGDHCMKSVVVCTPFVREILLGAMDEFVVLACDGLWDFVKEDDVVGVARLAFDRGLGAGEVAELLVRTAMERGSTDNVSVVVVQLDVDDCM